MPEKSRAGYMVKYQKEHYKRVSVLFSHNLYESIKAAAAASGESVNGYIKRAVEKRLTEQE